MRNNPTISIVAGLTSVGSLACLFLLVGELPPTFEARPHQAAGWMLAQEALGLLQKGGQITVITRDTSEFSQPAVDHQLDSFKRTIRKGHATIGTERMVEVDPLRLVEVPASDFFELIRKSQPGDVIVSLLGPPLLSEQQNTLLGPVRPKIVAFCSGNLPAQIDLRRLFQQHLLDVAVVSLHTPAKSSGGGLKECFDRYFRVIKAANVGSLYSGTGVQR